MSDIEDEVKCSECPNARHGFDRNASHNEGRYVCQCESHKCPAESLRQQLKDMTDQYNAAIEAEQVRYRHVVEKDAEIERLNSKLQSQALDCIAADGQAFDSWQQLAASQAREQQLRAYLEVITGKRMSADNCLGNVEIAELAIALPQDITALESMTVKAGEVMRERCAVECETHYNFSNALAAAIRALPAVTLDDLKD